MLGVAGRYVGSRPIKLRKSQWRDRNRDVIQKKCEGRFKAWKSVAVNTTFLATIAVQNSSYILRSIVQCMNRATTLDWVYVACYTPTEGNALFGDMKLQLVFQRIQEQNNLTASSSTKVMTNVSMFPTTRLRADERVAGGDGGEVTLRHVRRRLRRMSEMCEFEGQLYNLNASIGCLLCTTVGVTYGGKS
ncbi:hypothetical protein HAZT_HAZT011904 [Hyalella azteca]|uniref:Uncharacterized protein n=1 Tax=Hyalella azteca TaxID=294128 RepID=A0A6A0HDG6_HYAAZ|nr:hypothetical protein HAZT_HAZT011904 [Hyalella azteca]